MLNYHEIKELENKFGESFYVLYIKEFEKNFNSFKSSLSKHYPFVNLGYSYKTNYIPQVCKKADELGGYAEIVSGMELKIANKIGVHPTKLLFNGPIKSRESLRYCLLNGSKINVDNNSELQTIIDITNEYPDRNFFIGVRMNFNLGDHVFSRFGYDPESNDFGIFLKQIKEQKNLHLSGLHFHSTRKNKSIESYLTRLQKLVELLKKLSDTNIRYLDIGGGFYGKMDDNIRSQFEGNIPDFEDYGSSIGKKMRELFPDFDVELIVEPGLALTVNIMDFYTKIYNVKNIRGTKIATTYASFYNVKPSGHNKKLTMHIIKATNSSKNLENQIFNIAGYTCLENDYLFTGYSNNLLEEGDYLKFDNVGSYTIVFKPPFIKLSPPIIEFTDHGQRLVRSPEKFDVVFDSFIF